MDSRTYAWNYFAVHAAQRMGVFQFFVSLSTAIVAGAVLIAGNAEGREWAALLFILLPFLAFIFWRLDCRTSALIKNAERSLKWIETNKNEGQEGHDPVALFNNDERNAIEEKRQSLFGHMSYSQSFRYLFVAAAILGALGAIVVLLLGPAGAKVQEPETSQYKKLAENRRVTDTRPPQIEFVLPASASFRLAVGSAQKCVEGDSHGK